jgi:DNA-binding CsgD family transcriptional regulator
VSTEPTQTIGDRLKNAKQEQFTGREAELQLFESMLADNSGSSILNVYGPGGIGKSTLLDAFRRHSEAAGAAYLYLDAADFGNSAELFGSRLCAILPDTEQCELDCLFADIRKIARHRQVVIAIDTFEDIGDLNRWIRERFLSRLPDNCLVVIAGRHPLTDLWQSHPAWHSLISPLPLHNFDRAMTAQYLQRRGICDPSRIEHAWQFTAGHPLALSLSVPLLQHDAEPVSGSYLDADIVPRLTQRWLREAPDDRLRPFIEAAAIVRHFNQDLLERISDSDITANLFQQLTDCSFVRNGPYGWSLHGLVRDAVARELSQRSPERYIQLRIRALCSLAQAVIQPGMGLDRNTALQEFFYLLGDSLVRAALYNEETQARSDLYLEGASPDDVAMLEEYMLAWRLERGVLANTEVELFDRTNNQRIPQQIISEPREPEFLDMRELVKRFPGSVRLLKDQTSHLLGLNIVLPINAQTIPYLESQPVTGRYFNSLDDEQRHELSTPTAGTENWFVRLIDTRNPGDNAARALLFRDLAALLIKPARYITTTPLELYQSLLTRFGFQRLDLPPHYDFGNDRPAHFYELDLRGERLAQHLSSLMRQQLGTEVDLPFDTLLATVTPANNALQPEAIPEPMVEDIPELVPHLPLDELTEREREVALIAVEGLPNCSIAARLDITEVTVKKHMGQIFKKLGVRNRAELIRRFWSQDQQTVKTSDENPWR